METQAYSRKLPFITEVVELNDSDMPLMNEIHDVLKRHNALKRFGVTLLHDHFDVADDEVLIEFTNINDRIQTIEVTKKNDPLLSDAIETSWRLDTGLPVMECKCAKVDGHTHLKHLL